MDLKNLTKLMASSVLMVAISACETKKTDKKSETGSSPAGPSVPQTIQVAVDKNMDAEALVDAGEQLVGPYTFNLADKAFEMALAKDPNNKKAQFYRAFLKRTMVLKGILVRIKPYALAYGNIKGLEDTIRSLPNHPMRKFLLDGSEDIKDVTDIQKFLVTYRHAIEDFRNFVTKNPDLELDLYLNPSVFSEKIAKNLQTSCTIVDERNFTCDTINAATMKMNSADLIALKQEAAGEILYLTLFTSYSVQGIEPLLKDIETANHEVCRQIHHQDMYGGWDSEECVRPNRQISVREQLVRLDRTAGFGHLTADQSMKVVHSLGADLLAAAKWAMKYQKELCPNGMDSDRNRPGFLFSEGTFCVPDATSAQQSINLFEQILQGSVVVEHQTDHGLVRAETDYAGFFDHAVKDLRQLMPATWSSCDRATSFRDKTFGGLFPANQADQVMGSTSCEN